MWIAFAGFRLNPSNLPWPGRTTFCRRKLGDEEKEHRGAGSGSPVNPRREPEPIVPGHLLPKHVKLRPTLLVVDLLPLVWKSHQGTGLFS
jgi:hypothetical protein